MTERVVYVCRTPDGEFMPFDVGDTCPLPNCGALIDTLEAPWYPTRIVKGRDWRPHSSGIPAARCQNGHLLETEIGHTLWQHLTGHDCEPPANS